MHFDLNINGPQFLSLHLEEKQTKELPIDLSEKAEPTVLIIEGRPFIVTISKAAPEMTEKVQQKIEELKKQENLNLKQIYASVLNLTVENVNLEEKYATLASIEQLAQQTIRLNTFKTPTLKDTIKETLNRQIEAHDHILEKLKELDSYNIQQSEKVYYKALSVFTEIISTVKGEDLKQQLKAHKLDILRTSYKIHQQIVVNDTDNPEKQRAFDRLEHLLDQAIIIDYLAYTNQLISSGAQIQNRHLWYAVVNNSSEMMDKLIKEGGNPNAKSIDNQWSILQTACYRGHKSEEAARALVEKGADLKSQDENKETPIHAAIESDISDKTIEDFIQIVQDPNFANQAGKTLLHAAVNRAFTYKDPEILEFLLKLQANPNRQDEEGRTPLHLTIRAYEPHVLEVAKMLTEAGADVKIADKEGRTPLHYAAKRSISNADSGKKEGGKLAYFLIAKGAEVNFRDKKGRTPLHEAVGQGAKGLNQKTVLALINSGANLNIQDEEGNTPLHLAVWMEHVNHVKILLEKGANRNLRNKEGKLPGAMGVLGEGISKKRMEAILTLLANIK